MIYYDLKSFSPKNILSNYWKILCIEKKKKNIKKIFYHVIIPIIVSVTIIVILNGISKDLINTIGVLVSVLAGLLFNFVSSLHSHIPSNHLNQQSKEKIKRLELIKDTYTATFVSIFICISLIFLSLILNANYGISEENFWVFIKNGVKFFISIIVLILVYHLIIFLILMVNRLKKLMDTDILEEIKIHKNQRKKDVDHWD